MSLYISILTDQDILEYTEGRVVKDPRDINLKKTAKGLSAYKDGIYDTDIFGSYYIDRCKCGTQKIPGVCHECNVEVLEEVEAYTRYARIESPVYFLNSLRYKQFKLFFFDVFNNTHIKLDIESGVFTKKVLDSCQFNYNEIDEELTITEDITDLSKVSYEGIENIISEHFKSRLADYQRLVNKYLIVIPSVMRPFKFERIKGEPKLGIPDISIIYKSLIFATNYLKTADIAIKNDLPATAMHYALLRNYFDIAIQNSSDLLNSSKENLTRLLYSRRVTNSGRAVIVADPTLKIDEVSLPFHLAYESFKEDFIKYQQETYSYDIAHATDIVMDMNPIVEKEFKEWVVNRVAIINRNPTLHEFNLMAMKVKLNYNYTIGLPVMACKPFNADFDGDQMAFYAIPTEIEHVVVERMSPRNLVVFKKDLKPLFVPSHEELNGLNIASRVDAVDKPETFNTFSEIPEDYEQKEVLIKGRSTTYYRELISQIIEADLDIFTGPGQPISSSNIVKLIASLNDKPNRIEILKELQDLAVEVVTLEGVTTIDMKSLYMDLPAETLELIEDELNSDNDELTKTLNIEELYSKFLKEATDMLDPKIVNEVKSSDRIKMSALLKLMTPQMYISDDKTVTITKSTLAKGLSYLDYVIHSIENRKIQDIKVSSVPLAGYLQRQLVHGGADFVFKQFEKDENNQGILIPADRAEGRTGVDGHVLPRSSSKELVRVRSIVTSNQLNVTGDMVSPATRYKDGYNIGISMSSSLAERLVQSGLALKHGGQLYSSDDSFKVNSLVSGTIDKTMDGKWLIVESNSKRYEYPIVPDLIFTNKKEVKSGELLFKYPMFRTPSYRLDTIIYMIKARGTIKLKQHEKNEINLVDCIALSDGIINYMFDKDDNLLANINGKLYFLGSNVPYYPNGYTITKGQRISSGEFNLPNAFNISNSLEDIYLIFRNEFNKIMDSETTEELIELLFYIVTSKDKTRFVGLQKKSREDKSPFTQMSFGFAKKVVSDLSVLDDTGFGEDLMSSVILNHLITTNLTHDNQH